MDYDDENRNTDDLNAEYGTLADYADENTDWSEIHRRLQMVDFSAVMGIFDNETLPAAIWIQYYCNGKWYDKPKWSERKRRYIQCRWKVQENDGSIRYTESFVMTVYHPQPWHKRIMLYFRTKREQRRQSKTKRG